MYSLANVNKNLYAEVAERVRRIIDVIRFVESRDASLGLKEREREREKERKRERERERERERTW